MENNKIYCLTCNHFPLYTSFDIEKLKDKQKFLIDTIVQDESLTIIRKTESEIVYHTGIHYETDKYEICELEIL